jgi:predicted  nucleic acid-binding Zn-ribbon protein
MTQVVTPQQIESRLYALSKEVDEAHQGLVDTEREFHQTTAEYEIAMARTRISLASKSSPTGNSKVYKTPAEVLSAFEAFMKQVQDKQEGQDDD